MKPIYFNKKSKTFVPKPNKNTVEIKDGVKLKTGKILIDDRNKSAYDLSKEPGFDFNTHSFLTNIVKDIKVFFKSLK